MSLDNPFDPNDPNQQYLYGGAPPNDYNTNWLPAPIGSDNAQNGNQQNLFGYNPSTSNVGQVNLNAYASQPNSLAGGWSPPANLYANTATNLFDPHAAYASTPANTASAVNAATVAAYNPSSSQFNQPTTTAASGAASGGATGGTGSTTGGSGVGAVGATGTSGTSTAGSGGGFNQAAWSDPNDFYINYEKQLLNSGINPLSNSPAAQLARNAASRAYANYVAGLLDNTASMTDTTGSIQNFINSGGQSGNGASVAQNLMNLYNQVLSGALTASDPRFDVVRSLAASPTMLTQMFANLAPSNPFTRYRQQYLQDLGNYNQVAGNPTTPGDYIVGLLRGLGAT